MLCELPDANPPPRSPPPQAFPGSPSDADGAQPDIALEWPPTPGCTAAEIKEDVAAEVK